MKPRWHLHLTCVIFLVCPIVLPGAAPAQDPARDPRQDASPGPSDQLHLRAAQRASAQGNSAAAMAEVRAALAANNASAAAWYQLGTLLGQAGDFPGAESALRHSINIDPLSARAHYGLALTFIGNPQAKQDWTGTITECREALRLQPDYAEALNLLGAGLNNTGQPQAALEPLRRAVTLSPLLAEAHFNLALTLENLAANQTTAGSSPLFVDAVAQYQAAIAARGSYPEASTALGKLQLQLGHTAEAEQDERTALRADPDLAGAHYTLARALHALKRNRESAAEFAEAEDRTARQAEALESAQRSNQGLQLAATGDLAGAAVKLREAIALKPDYGVPHYNLGLILADTGDRNGAAQELTKGISLLPGQPQPWFALGRLLALQNNYQDALADLQYAAYLAPTDPAIRAALSSTRAANSSQPALTLPDETFAIRQPPVGAAADTPSAHLAFAADLSRSDDALGAAGELLRALALEPSRVDARLQLAATYRKLQQPGRALLEYRKVLLLSPENVDATVAIAQLLLAGQDREGAISQLQQALRLRPRSPELRAMLAQAQAHAPAK